MNRSYLFFAVWKLTWLFFVDVFKASITFCSLRRRRTSTVCEREGGREDWWWMLYFKRIRQ
jgi:hypothetical protein